MIAKLIAHGPTREAALAELAEACDAVEVWPVKTNAGFLARCLEAPDFIAGDVDTGFIERNLETLTAELEPSPTALACAASAVLGEEATADTSPWSGLTGFRLNAAPQTAVRLFLAGKPVMADLTDAAADRAALITPDDRVVVFEAGEAFVFSQVPPSDEAGEEGGDGAIRSPMPGKVTQLSVKAGDAVKKGQALVTLEAMKMEHALTAPFDGKVEAVGVALGDQVSEGAVLVMLKASDPAPASP
jgi:acetyl/propionyl-CoA carboxylase alpha subunit